MIHFKIIFISDEPIEIRKGLCFSEKDKSIPQPFNSSVIEIFTIWQRYLRIIFDEFKQ